MSARRVLVPLALALAVLWPAAIPAAAQDPTPPGECSDMMELDDIKALQPGQTGIGWTVPRGVEPRPFAVEVVGYFEDGIRPGFDIILIRVSDWPGEQFIENARGIWAGVSGSPVYIDDKLIGAVAWGFSAGPSKLGGVTPITEMRKVGDLDASQVRMSKRLRDALQQRVRASVEVTDFGQLRIPMILADSRTRGPRGGTRKKRAAIRARFDLPRWLAGRGVEVVPTTVARAQARSVGRASTAIVPGGNFGASLSFGTLDAVGIGTVTRVCGDRVLVFGHEFFLTGASNLGAHGATALDVVDDPTFSPFKLAVPGERVGQVTQDRGSALAARLGRTPQTVEVTSEIFRSSSGPTEAGRTEVYAQVPRPLVYILPSDHAFFELLRFIDAFEDGSVGIELDVSGRREDGTRFRVTFGDRWIGAERPGEEFFDSISAGAVGVGLMLSWLVDFPFDRVTLDDVHMELDVGSPNRWVITDVEVSREGGPPQSGSPVCVERGDDLTVQVSLESEPGAGSVVEQFQIRVPRRFGALHVRGGNGLPPFFDPTAFADLDGLLRRLRRATRADDAIVRIVKNGVVQRSTTTTLDRVIVGNATVLLRPLGSPACS